MVDGREHAGTATRPAMHGRLPVAGPSAGLPGGHEVKELLGRTDEPLALLQKCRHEFQQANDVRCLGMTMSALGEVENRRNRGNAAITLVRDGLRYTYMAGDVTSIAVSYRLRGWPYSPVVSLTSETRC